MTQLTTIDAKIDKLRKQLSVLYAAKKLARKKLAKVRPSQEEQATMALLLAKTKTIDEIATAMNRKKETVKHLIWVALWAASNEALLTSGRATVERPNGHGGETWSYDTHEKHLEMIAINASLVGKLSNTRGGFFGREHLKTCRACQNAMEKYK